MRNLIRTAALVGAAVVTLGLAVERAYAAPVLAEVEAVPCFCDPSAKLEPSRDTSFGGKGVPTTRSVIDSFPGASTMTYSLAALEVGRGHDEGRMLSVSVPRAHDWLSERLRAHLQLDLIPSALPLLGIGFAALGLLARRRSAGDWQILDSE